jgi:energy-converting hydrogenase Eha subunit H
MLTRELFFGLNIISLAGFAVMGIVMSLARQQRLRAPLALALMGVGTALLLFGFWVGPPAPR